MSSATAAPARSDAPHDWALRRPDGTPATLAQAWLGTRSDPRTSCTHEGDGLLELTVWPLDPGGRADSGHPLTATIARELANTRPQRARGAGSSITSQVHPRGTPGTVTPGAPHFAACQAALHCLLARYTEIASRFVAQPQARPRYFSAQAASDPLAPGHVPDRDLEDVLFFRRFSRSEITALRDGLRVLSGPRGTRIDTHSTLWIVLRGAVQTSLRHGASTCRLRVAGPGRCVAHPSLIAHRTPNPASLLEAEFRERAVVLEVPVERAHSLLADDTPAARRFAQAFNEDIARALHDAERPFAPAVAKRELPSIRLATLDIASVRAQCTGPSPRSTAQWQLNPGSVDPCSGRACTANGG